MDNGWKGEEPRVMGTSVVVIMTMFVRGPHRVKHIRITGRMLRSRFLDSVPKDSDQVDLAWIKGCEKKNHKWRRGKMRDPMRDGLAFFR